MDPRQSGTALFTISLSTFVPGTGCMNDLVTSQQVKPETNRRLSETRDLTGKGEIVVIVGRAAADCIQCDRGFTLTCGYRVFHQICFILAFLVSSRYCYL